MENTAGRRWHAYPWPSGSSAQPSCPHVVYLHSALAKDRIQAAGRQERQTLLIYSKWDCNTGLGIAGLVKLSMLCIAAAVHAGFGYFQREAGYTRTGSHGTRVHGRETGQWHEANLAVAYWLQHTSRDGDMQLHIHSQIGHVAKTATDGKWRAPDSLGYNEHIGAVAAIVTQHPEEALTHRFGLEGIARDDGHGFEIKGISGGMMRVFSSRRESITADLRACAARFEQRYGRKPSQRELAPRASRELQNTRVRQHPVPGVAAVLQVAGRGGTVLRPDGPAPGAEGRRDGGPGVHQRRTIGTAEGLPGQVVRRAP